jgi:hypothetical protein
MATFRGSIGNVYWDAADGVNKTALTNIQSWSCEINVDAIETTSMQHTWKRYATGFKNWTATVECLVDSTGIDIPVSTAEPQPMGNTAKLELYFKYDTSSPLYQALYGSAKCTGQSFGTNADGAPTVTLSFQGVAAIAHHSATVVPTYT